MLSVNKFILDNPPKGDGLFTDSAAPNPESPVLAPARVVLLALAGCQTQRNFGGNSGYLGDAVQCIVPVADVDTARIGFLDHIVVYL